MSAWWFLFGWLCGIAFAGVVALAIWRHVQRSNQRAEDTFASLSATALRQASTDFLQLAETALSKTTGSVAGDLAERQQALQHLLQPIEKALQRLTSQAEEMERKRVSAYDSISEQVKSLASEADQLASALRRPTVRGSWGELVLRTVCENAGLTEGEHFVVQDYNEGEQGVLKPDMVIKLPKGRVLILDSKMPMDAFREALEATSQSARSDLMQKHAKHVREHIRKLSAKSYWSRYSESPDCTVLFIPTESAYYAAIEADPAIVEVASKAKIILANPMTLIGVLRAVAHVLNEERLQENAVAVRDLGQKLYQSLNIVLNHTNKLGKCLKLAGDSYNDLVGAIEKTVASRAKKLQELGAGVSDPQVELTALEEIGVGA